MKPARQFQGDEGMSEISEPVTSRLPGFHKLPRAERPLSNLLGPPWPRRLTAVTSLAFSSPTRSQLTRPPVAFHI